MLILLTAIAAWYRGSASTEGPKPTDTPTPRTPTSVPNPHSDTTPTANLKTPSIPAEAQTLKLLEGPRPNLVIVDVVYEDPYIVVHYANNGGQQVAADFNISLSANDRTFAGNSNYRNRVPTPGVIVKTGGFTPGLIGLKSGQSAEVLVTIDPENRVRELLKSDNSMLCRVDLASGTVQKMDPSPESPNAIESQGPDLIVTNAQLDDHKLTVSLANQGDQESNATFTMGIFRAGQQIHSVPNLSVPDPQEQVLLMDIPLLSLNPSDLIEIQLDTTGAVSESREGNNSYIRQLDNSHNL